MYCTQAHSFLCSEAFISPSSNKLETLEALTFCTQIGKKFQRYPEIPQHHLAVFSSVIKLDVSRLSPSQNIRLFQLFSQWNLLPPEGFQFRLQRALLGQLNQWTAREFLYFSLARKLSPLKLTLSFKKAYIKRLVEVFDTLNSNVQMEALGAELFHGTFFSSKEMRYLLEQTSISLTKLDPTLRLKPLKELYRGLLHLRATEPGHFSLQIIELEKQLDLQLQTQGLSLAGGGLSGTNNPKRRIDENQTLLEQRIAQSFPNETKIYEYSDPSAPGFFDPVDIYYPNMRLVVEWDGVFHYYRQLNTKGQVITSSGSLTLRPMDQAKDKALRRRGVLVLRFSPELNSQLKNLNLINLIKEQNPNMELN